MLFFRPLLLVGALGRLPDPGLGMRRRWLELSTLNTGLCLAKGGDADTAGESVISGCVIRSAGGTPSTLVWEMERRGAVTRSTSAEGVGRHGSPQHAHPSPAPTKGCCLARPNLQGLPG